MGFFRKEIGCAEYCYPKSQGLIDNPYYNSGYNDPNPDDSLDWVPCKKPPPGGIHDESSVEPSAIEPVAGLPETESADPQAVGQTGQGPDPSIGAQYENPLDFPSVAQIYGTYSPPPTKPNRFPLDLNSTTSGNLAIPDAPQLQLASANQNNFFVSPADSENTGAGVSTKDFFSAAAATSDSDDMFSGCGSGGKVGK